MKQSAFLILLMLAACKPTTQLEVIRPAAISLPDHIEVIATVDRSKPRSGFVDVLESEATGEALNQDRNGRLRALEALNETLIRTPRFQVIETGEELSGTESGSTFADPLSWREVQRICRKHRADALIALEKFDSNNFVEVTSRKRKRKTDEGEVEETVFDAKAETDVEIGWRIYDVKGRQLIDEVSVNDSDSDSHSGAESKALALKELNDPLNMTYTVSSRAGRKYAERIAPLWIKLSRTFYRKAKGPYAEDMTRAARMFEAESWTQAEDIWTRIIQDSMEPEVQGMAAYNLAVFNEKMGLLSTAVEWAQRSYGDFGNKKAKTYLNTLRGRIQDQQRLAEQMKQRS
ncbi:MAG: hypothetical protein KTR24_01955 [Saprospiraceae bacterium]|nr:hypothetical protein [Saprospiraceae bacterium]